MCRRAGCARSCRRVSSDAATMRLREAASSDLLSAFAIAVATSSVKFSSRSSAPAGNGSDRCVATSMTPQRRPSTAIGAPIADLQPCRRAISAASPEASSYSSIRAGFPVSATIVKTLRPPTTERVPTGTPPGDALQFPIAVRAPSPSYRPTTVMSVSNNLPTAIATASKTSVEGASRATSVATCLRAACSSASSVSSSRLSAFAIAVAISSVNAARRASVWGGSGSSLCCRPTATMPHTLPSTTIGAPTADRTSETLDASAIGPDNTFWSTRAGLTASRMPAFMVPSSGRHRLPTGKPGSLCDASTTEEPSGRKLSRCAESRLRSTTAAARSRGKGKRCRTRSPTSSSSRRLRR